MQINEALPQLRHIEPRGLWHKPADAREMSDSRSRGSHTAEAAGGRRCLSRIALSDPYQGRADEVRVLMHQAQIAMDERDRLYEDMAARDGTRFHPF